MQLKAAPINCNIHRVGTVPNYYQGPRVSRTARRTVNQQAAFSGESRQSATDGRARRTVILDAALKMFYENGYSATTMQQIADEVGILKGSLYHHISGKEELLYEVLLRIHEGFPKPPPAKKYDEDLLETIRGFVYRYVMHITQNVASAAVFHREIRWLPPNRRSVIVRKRDVNDTYLRHAISVGIERGIIPPSIDPKLASMAIFGMANGLHVWFQEGGAISSEELATTYADYAIRLLRY
jgi:AcrR family transcriptional regulator